MNGNTISQSSASSAADFLTAALANQLDLFHGDANPAVARAYLRLRNPLPEGISARKLQIVARLVGPTCEFAQTLPLRMPFIELKSDTNSNALLAEATVPDPNFWTPELPFIYRADIELRRGDDILLKHKRQLSIRRFGARGKFLSFEGKRFVLRGAYATEANPFSRARLRREHEPAETESAEFGVGSAEFARESWTTVVAPNPNDEACEFASRNGILLVADLTACIAGDGIAGLSIAAELHRLAQWPGVCIAILPTTATVSKDLRAFAPNLTLAQFVPAEESIPQADWADLAFVEVADSKQFAEKTEGFGKPIVAVRRAQNFESLEQARAACDELQYELTRFDDYSGYIV